MKEDLILNVTKDILKNLKISKNEAFKFLSYFENEGLKYYPIPDYIPTSKNGMNMVIECRCPEIGMLIFNRKRGDDTFYLQEHCLDTCMDIKNRNKMCSAIIRYFADSIKE